jgi:hypothetical protein
MQARGRSTLAAKSQDATCLRLGIQAANARLQQDFTEKGRAARQVIQHVTGASVDQKDLIVWTLVGFHPLPAPVTDPQHRLH